MKSVEDKMEIVKMVEGLSVTNLVIAILLIGVIFWLIRQLLSEKAEKAKLWKVVLRIGPSILGGLIAFIPHLRAVETNLTHSIAIGCICGPITQTCYGIFRQIAPEKIRLFLGSRSKRLTSMPPPAKKGSYICSECGQEVKK
jgi:hypothetical protein